MNCQHCNRLINNKGSLKAHEIRCHSNPDRKVIPRSPKAGAQKGCVTWNKNKTWQEDGRISRHSKGGFTGNHSTETKERLSVAAKKRKLGGYIEGSGRGKKGRYKGYWCDSSWELAWVIYQLDHGISFVRNWKKFEYQFEGISKHWIPDFRIDDVYYEIKGYDTEQNQAKRVDFPEKLIVLKQDDLSDIFDYVIDKYGKDYIKLYE